MLSCPNKSGVLYKELLELNNNDEDLATYAHNTITQLQDQGIISMTRYKKQNGNYVYKIPKIMTERSLAKFISEDTSGYEIDRNKLQSLKDYIEFYEVSFIKPEITKSGKAIFVNITPVEYKAFEKPKELTDNELSDQMLREQEEAEDREIKVNRVQESINNIKPGTQLSLFGLDTKNQEELEFNINTLNIVSKFLQNVGIKERLVSNFLSEDGSVIKGAIAAANFIEGTIDIADQSRTNIINDSNLTDQEKSELIVNFWKKVDSKMPEEAAHFWYRLLKEDAPLKKILWEAHETALKANELYKNQYGKLKGINKPEDLTEEAIGQLVAEAIKRIETKNASASNYSFFKKFLEWINSILNVFKNTTQDPFEIAAMKILNSDISDLMTLDEYYNLYNLANPNNQQDVITLTNEKIISKNEQQIFESLLKRVKTKKRLPKQETIEIIKKIITNPDLIKNKLTSNYIKENKVESLIPTLLSFNNLQKKYSKGIPVKDNLNIDGAKAFDIYIYDVVRNNIIKNEDLKSNLIDLDTFEFYLLEHLQNNYLLNFENLNKWSDYRISQTFLDETTRHRKIAIRFNNEYFKESTHFSYSPLAWGNITYFKSNPELLEPDSVLIHEIQSDLWERLTSSDKNNLQKILEFLKVPSLFKKINYDNVDFAYEQFIANIEEYEFLFGDTENFINDRKKESEKLRNDLIKNKSFYKNNLNNANDILKKYADNYFEFVVFENERYSFNKNYPIKNAKQLLMRMQIQNEKKILKRLSRNNETLQKLFRDRKKYQASQDYKKLSKEKFEELWNNIKSNISLYKTLADSKDKAQGETLDEKYFNPLMHYLIQTIIKEKGKNFPIYFSGKEITLLTQVQQPNEKSQTPTADLYAGQEEVNKGIVNKIGPMYNKMKKLNGIKLEYQEEIPGFVKKVGGYKVNVSNYNFQSPVLFGLDNTQSNIKPGVEELFDNFNSEDIQDINNLLDDGEIEIKCN